MLAGSDLCLYANAGALLRGAVGPLLHFPLNTTDARLGADLSLRHRHLQSGLALTDYTAINMSSRPAGSVWAMGSNEYSELGLGADDDAHLTAAVPPWLSWRPWPL